VLLLDSAVGLLADGGSTAGKLHDAGVHGIFVPSAAALVDLPDYVTALDDAGIRALLARHPVVITV
jgi:hypothetical protein